jgi:hypothetical protein
MFLASINLLTVEGRKAHAHLPKLRSELVATNTAPFSRDAAIDERRNRENVKALKTAGDGDTGSLVVPDGLVSVI